MIVAMIVMIHLRVPLKVKMGSRKVVHKRVRGRNHPSSQAVKMRMIHLNPYQGILLRSNKTL